MSTIQEHGPLQAAQIASSTDASMLIQIVGAIAQVTGSRSSWIEHHDPLRGVTEVVASYGDGAPPVGSPGRTGDLADALTFPLRINGDVIGVIVCTGTPHAVMLSPNQPGQIELLTTLAASALRNLSLVRELEMATSAAIERRFRLLNGLVLYLKNTLGAAGEYVKLIAMESDMTPRQGEYIGASQRNIEVALRLLAELVDLGRVETGRLPVSNAATDPCGVLRGIVRDYELSNGTSGVHFVLELDDGLPVIDTDVDLMRRILDTLLSNAVKYSTAGATVHIAGTIRAGRRSDDPQQWVCITVTDEGPGVADRDLVFEEVARAESTSSTPGFRLAISRRIARLLGGDLSLDSSAERGSSFSLWLPTRAPALSVSALATDEDAALERADADLRAALAERE